MKLCDNYDSFRQRFGFLCRIFNFQCHSIIMCNNLQGEHKLNTNKQTNSNKKIYWKYKNTKAKSKPRPAQCLNINFNLQFVALIETNQDKKKEVAFPQKKKLHKKHLKMLFISIISR